MCVWLCESVLLCLCWRARVYVYLFSECEIYPVKNNNKKKVKRKNISRSFLCVFITFSFLFFSILFLPRRRSTSNKIKVTGRCQCLSFRNRFTLRRWEIFTEIISQSLLFILFQDVLYNRNWWIKCCTVIWFIKNSQGELCKKCVKI